MATRVNHISDHAQNLVFSWLLYLSDIEKSKAVQVSVRSLMDRTGLARPQVQNALDALRKDGCIKLQRRSSPLTWLISVNPPLDIYRAALHLATTPEQVDKWCEAGDLPAKLNRGQTADFYTIEWSDLAWFRSRLQSKTDGNELAALRDDVADLRAELTGIRAAAERLEHVVLTHERSIGNLASDINAVDRRSRAAHNLAAENTPLGVRFWSAVKRIFG